jgi:hypothetical protein
LGDCQALYPWLPRTAAIITDGQYDANYDATKDRRVPSQYDHNPEGSDHDYDPKPWLTFAETILFGSKRYWERHAAELPPEGSWLWWDKVPGRQPAKDFEPGEWIWRSKAGPPDDYHQLWMGQQREGEENYVYLPQKLHVHQKPIRLMTKLVKETSAPIIVDPYMGSGTTLAACVRLGRPCIGIEIRRPDFETACTRLQEELQLSKESREVLRALTQAARPLTTRELAHELLVPVETMRQRLKRMRIRGEVLQSGESYSPCSLQEAA